MARLDRSPIEERMPGYHAAATENWVDALLKNEVLVNATVLLAQIRRRTQAHFEETRIAVTAWAPLKANEEALRKTVFGIGDASSRSRE